MVLLPSLRTTLCRTPISTRLTRPSMHILRSTRFISTSLPVFNENASHPESDHQHQNQQGNQRESFASRFSSSSVIEMALGTVLGLGLLGMGGAGYLLFYKWDVLRKMENSFAGGYDPVLELEKAAAKESGDYTEHYAEPHIRRPEQDLIDDIMNGKKTGHYYLLLGPKGTGKTSMIIDAMSRNNAEGASMCDAHESQEIFRVRFGKCIDFEYFEDWYGGLFQRKEPRDGGPLLDIERAMNKLEKVAIRYRKKNGRPLCLVFNNVHFFHNDEAGHELIHLLQQRAESWAASGVCTMVFSSDDRWVFDKMKKHGSRMQVVSVGDLSLQDTIRMVVSSRMRYFNQRGPEVEKQAKEMYKLVGGRLSLIGTLVKEKDMIKAAHALIDRESSWINSHVGLIVDCDDDVMDEQKFSSSSWLLFAEFVKRAKELESEGITLDNDSQERKFDIKVDYGEARQVMTRTDFLLPLDHLNLVTIDVNHQVRPESIMLLNAMRKVVSQEGFDEKLESVLDRISAIESLGRTRELIWKMGPEEGAVARIKVER